MDKKICFFTVATGRWKMFILPYIFSVLYFNKDAFVEVLTRFEDVFTEGIVPLAEMFNYNFKIRELPAIDPARKLPDAALRFVLEPQIKCEYTYIGDVDILVLQSGISKYHEDIMAEANSCYSNIVRPNNVRRFTGLHVVKSQPYYDATRELRDTISIKHGNDEMLLYEIVEKCIGDPLLYTNEKICEHGFHLSLMREPKIDPANPMKPAWSIRNTEYQKTYFELKETAEWKAIYPFFDPEFKDILRRAEEAF